MNKRHIFIFLAILTTGLAIEGLKKMAGVKPATQDTNAIVRDLEIKPFQLSDSTLNNETESIRRGRGFSAFKGGMKLSQVNEATKLIPSTIISPQTTDSDEAKKKAEQKKKKAKKKKENARKIAAKKESKTNLNEVDEDKDVEPQSPADQSVTYVQGPIEPPNPELNQEKKDQISYEEWAKLILGGPQPENVSKLVDAFKVGKVSAEVFYRLLAAMMDEENTEQHKLAVSAADRTPNSQSYVFLFAVLKSEQQGTEVANQAQTAINSYTRLNLIGELRSAIQLHIDDRQFVLYSLSIVERSTQTYLGTRDPANTQPANVQTDSQGFSKNQTRTAEQLNRLRKAYLPFVQLLENVKSKYKDFHFVVVSAQVSLDRIKNILVVQEPAKS